MLAATCMACPATRVAGSQHGVQAQARYQHRQQRQSETTRGIKIEINQGLNSKLRFMFFELSRVNGRMYEVTFRPLMHESFKTKEKI